MDRYAKVDVRWWCHPKVLGLSLEARGLWISGMTYCAHNATGGFMAHKVADMLCASQGDHKESRVTLCDSLVRAGLLEPVENGWLFHDYGELQDGLEKIRENARTRQAEKRARDKQDQVTPSHTTSRVTGRDSHISFKSKSKTESKSKNLIPPVVPHSGDDVELVFSTWLSSTGRKRASLFGETGRQRVRLIRRALKDYPLDDVVDAVRGHLNDPWADRPLHAELSVLLRDAEHIEKFRDLWRNGRPATGTNAAQGAELLRWLEKSGEETAPAPPLVITGGAS